MPHPFFSVGGLVGLGALLTGYILLRLGLPPLAAGLLGAASWLVLMLRWGLRGRAYAGSDKDGDCR